MSENESRQTEQTGESIRQEVLIGNGAIALGLLQAGCEVLTSYPGTPSSEIVPAAVLFNARFKLGAYVEWSANEKVAYDVAYAASLSGKRAAVAMKQVGLNVACDTLMSQAYMGVVGGFVAISADDPGPHSSQTEQDTRLLAHFAKVPVLDPCDPEEARRMAIYAFALSEKFKTPVILRPAIRVCHAKQDIRYQVPAPRIRKADFTRDVNRWAATPRFRLALHRELNEKLEAIRSELESGCPFNYHNLKNDTVVHPLGIITGGAPHGVICDILEEMGLDESVPVLKLGAPYPLPEKLVAGFMARCNSVLVVEETDAVIELLIRDKSRVLGRFTGHVPPEGELVPEKIHAILARVFRETGAAEIEVPCGTGREALSTTLDLPVRKPTLCPGCPHRAVYYAIEQTFPEAIFPSDIGCYTLGMNIGGVDTVVDMGASIGMASGFYQAHRKDGIERPIIATIGDSTFYHGGTAALLNAVYNDARFILLILDNDITAMTGMQPTIGLGTRADGSRGKAVPLPRLVEGCGVDYVKIHDPYDVDGLMTLLEEAYAYTKKEDGGIAVVICKHPCLIAYREAREQLTEPVTVTDACSGCMVCIETFECPALRLDETAGRVEIDRMICTNCGVCISICPTGAIEKSPGV